MTIDQLQNKVQLLEKNNCDLNNQLSACKNEANQLNIDLNNLKRDKDQMEAEYKKKLEVLVIHHGTRVPQSAC